MDKLARFNGICNFLAAHWKAGTHDKIMDLSWIPKEKIAMRNLAAKVAMEYLAADETLNVLWDEDISIFIKALKRWAQASLSVIEFMEIA